MAKQKRPAVTIRVSDSGSVSRRKRALTKEDRAAKKQADEQHVALPRAKVIAIMARAKAARREDLKPNDLRASVLNEARLYDSRQKHAAVPAAPDAYTRSAERLERTEARGIEEEQRRSAYLRQVSENRVSASGATGKRAEKVQSDVYRLLGLDRTAGYDGRPPAFEVTEKHKVGQSELLAGVRNCARDPIHILRTQGVLSDRQHTAAVALSDLFEQHASIGLRAMAFAEAIDGGKAPDVSTHALAVARRMAEWRRAFNEVDRGLLTAVAIDGQTISALARAGTYGANRARVKDKLTAALERLANWFGVK